MEAVDELSVLRDPYDRLHDYLRISVTDRCNFRCVYCMPANGMKFLPSDRLLSFEEIEAVVRAGAEIGIRRLRLTGGEPLVRPHLEKLVERLASIPQIDDIALTTNGMFLAEKAAMLRDAGLNRVNISLDSLNPERFAQMTRGGDFHKVWKGVLAALEANLAPVKLNVVVVKGFNDDEADSFLKLTMDYPLHVRFIEYMPIGHADEGWSEGYLPLKTIRDRCEQLGVQWLSKGEIRGNGPSENGRLLGAVGTIGLIHPVSDHFCESCNRLRLTADGMLKPCLYWDHETSVKGKLTREELLPVFFQALKMKPLNHEMALAQNRELQSHEPTHRRMSQIGG